ncbi:unnamed protein product [Pleuronectes platessa]|uniref:Uncharacterized protein n=1 Tax=Pleuronectes platessa TaxID=8262 RepID=A0A9N7W0R8_PLEPL|nr:unnamed protein product [Pleuronectes platessa]
MTFTQTGHISKGLTVSSKGSEAENHPALTWANLVTHTFDVCLRRAFERSRPRYDRAGRVIHDWAVCSPVEEADTPDWPHLLLAIEMLATPFTGHRDAGHTFYLPLLMSTCINPILH